MNLRELKFGIEIETVGITRNKAAAVIAQAINGQAIGNTAIAEDGRIWEAAYDGSLPGVHAEVVSPILKYDDIETLQEVIRALRHAGAKPHARAGIHIHIEAAPFGVNQLSNLAKIIYKQEDLLIRALGVSSSRLNSYTKPISTRFINEINRRKPKTKSEFKRAYYGDNGSHTGHYDSNRYHILNLHSAFNGPTVEIRAFESTLHAGKIKAYIQFVLALAAKAINARSAQSEKRQFNAESAKYDLRVFLLGLGMIGKEFKTARLHLLNNMPGDSAFRTYAQRTAHNLRRAS